MKCYVPFMASSCIKIKLIFTVLLVILESGVFCYKDTCDTHQGTTSSVGIFVREIGMTAYIKNVTVAVRVFGPIQNIAALLPQPASEPRRGQIVHRVRYIGWKVSIIWNFATPLENASTISSQVNILLYMQHTHVRRKENA